MSDQDRLARAFEAERERLRAIAGRMLGSAHEADDAVQEAWLRLSRANAAEIENLGGWLTTVTSRICLDQLRARTVRREEPIDAAPDRPVEIAAPDDPEAESLLAESVGAAVLVMLDRLSPAERVAFVLHDMFSAPFDEIGLILDRTPATARQLASRARRKVRGAEPAPATDASDLAVIDAFLTASRNGDLAGILNVLAPGVAVYADATAAAYGVDAITEGNELVARFFNGRAAAAFLARIEGTYGAVWMMHGAPRVAFHFTIDDGVIERIDLVGDPERLAAMEYELVTGSRRS
ncbi:MAG: sigma-70 family RNA polymerase sigma factor [Thermomicrobiales bacterium]|nr:sigma-70 family RNA polymerase sigma factor [Thermomicrobiales bacterium]